ncbi:hypothetical protein BGZ61DRAFT_188696 [Ilyonectria robusta]|uniref:uncharacterized protein n=1 Tax=Ilyonectria robusta TaxID=1079257 RepID=UPI001E8DC3C1|nr:uncharacterized protein BGZ61DRAFT_188696 [Ilyonectria robusta]KAH8729987.1 hypothetical protein BGZ61DRAFT_188696 [Ilyonectria robusta]
MDPVAPLSLLAEFPFPGLAISVLKLFDGSKHRPLIEWADGHKDTVEKAANLTFGGPDQDEPPPYRSTKEHNARFEILEKHRGAYDELIRMLQPKQKRKVKELIRNATINARWSRVCELADIMKEQGKRLEKALHYDWLRWQQEQHRAILQALQTSRQFTNDTERNAIPIEEYTRPADWRGEVTGLSRVQRSDRGPPSTSLVLPPIPQYTSPQDAQIERLNPRIVSIGDKYHWNTQLEQPPTVVAHLHKNVQRQTGTTATPSWEITQPDTLTREGDDPGTRVSRRIVKRTLSLPLLSASLIPDHAISSRSASEALESASSAAKETVASVAGAIATTANAASSATSSLPPGDVQKFAIATAVFAGAVAASKACDSFTTAQIGYRNANIARQVANTGNRNAEIASQTAIAARIAADAQDLTAKTAAEKWEFEKQKKLSGAKEDVQSAPRNAGRSGGGDDDDESSGGHASDDKCAHSAPVAPMASKAVMLSSPRSSRVPRFQTPPHRAKMHLPRQRQIVSIRAKKKQAMKTTRKGQFDQDIPLLNRDKERALELRLAGLRAVHSPFSTSPPPSHPPVNGKSTPKLTKRLGENISAGPGTETAPRAESAANEVNIGNFNEVHSPSADEDGYFDREESGHTNIPLRVLQSQSHAGEEKQEVLPIDHESYCNASHNDGADSDSVHLIGNEARETMDENLPLGSEDPPANHVADVEEDEAGPDSVLPDGNPSGANGVPGKED